jgi:hypothetical protein
VQIGKLSLLNVDFRIIKDLCDKGFNVISILEDYRSFSDKEVLQLARDKKALILTEDKDFGEWVFAHKEKKLGCYFLRYKSDEINLILTSSGCPFHPSSRATGYSRTVFLKYHLL